jgi:hypothetical protein
MPPFCGRGRKPNCILSGLFMQSRTPEYGDVGLRVVPWAKGSFEPICDRLSCGTGQVPIVARCEIKSVV